MLKVTLLLISMGAVGATILGTRPALLPSDDTDRKSSDLTVSAGSADMLEVNIPLGDVTVIADNSREMTVHVVRSAKKPIDGQARRWLNDSYLKAESHGNVLTVRDHPFGKDSLNNLNERGSDGKGRDLNLEVQIHVPAELAAKLEVSVGVADVEGRFRSLDAKVGAGVLKTDSVRCSGKTDLHVGAGEVKISIPSGASEEVSASVGVGQITGLPDNSNRKEGIHLGDKRRGHTGQGDSKVDVHVGAGSIKVDSKDRILASISPEGEKADEADDAERADKGDEAYKANQIDIRIDDKLGETISKSMEMAMKAMHESLGSVNSNVKIDLGDMKFNELSDLKELKNLDQDVNKDLAKEMAKIGPEIEKAVKNFKPEFERSMRDMKPQIDKEMKKAMAEVEKAMKTVKPEIEKAMRQIKPEIEKAIREAMKELDRAEKELKVREKADRD